MANVTKFVGFQLPHKPYSITSSSGHGSLWVVLGCGILTTDALARLQVGTIPPEQTSLRELGTPGGVPISTREVAENKLRCDFGRNTETGSKFVEVPQRAMVTHLLDVPVQCWCNLRHRPSLVTVRQRRRPLERLHSLDDKHCILSWPLVRTALIRTLPSRTLVA